MWHNNDVLAECFIFVFFMKYMYFIKILFLLHDFFVFAFRVYTKWVCLYVYLYTYIQWVYIYTHSFLEFWGYFCFLYPSSTPYWDGPVYTGCDLFLSLSFYRNVKDIFQCFWIVFNIILIVWFYFIEKSEIVNNVNW